MGSLFATSPVTCPCGSGARFDGCCGPLLDGEPGATAEAVMRSRYTAYVLGHRDHLIRTWHPRTRPTGGDLDAHSPSVAWTRLVVLETRDGDVRDETGVVVFEAHFRAGDRDEVMREVSWFEHRARRWFYVGPLDET